MHKFIHVRSVTPIESPSSRLNDQWQLENTGGLTIAFTHTDDDLFFAVACCSFKDQFCRAAGREVASNRFLAEGPLEILPAARPFSETLVAWVAENYFDSPIRIFKLGHKWVSTFEAI